MTKDSASGKSKSTYTNFGSKRVSAETHSRLIKGVFDTVAAQYDVMNDLMSGGLHRLWKKTLIDCIRIKTKMCLVDVAGGTGDIALKFLQKTSHQKSPVKTTHKVVICEPNKAMLNIAKGRALDFGFTKELSLTNARAESLPFAEHFADVATISFGLRNVTNRSVALGEIFRILTIGGHFLCLEFSPNIIPILAPIYTEYSQKFLPWLGQKVVGEGSAYEYLVESIQNFPKPEKIKEEMALAGFANIRFRSLSGGLVALYSGWRI